MRIGIIGGGFVGSAVAHAHQHDEVLINDPKHPYSTPLTDFVDCDAIFVCVPSPSAEEGYCDTSILEDVLKNLFFVTIATQIPIISKVTAPPSVYERLQKQYPNLVHAPEFLTAKNALWEYKFGKLCVIGGNQEWSGKAAKVILQGMVEVRLDNVRFSDIKTAALYKYLMNSYLAMKVTFMNDFYELAQAQNIDWNDIQMIARSDERIGNTHLSVPGNNGEYGWGGGCFPKDVSAIIMEAIDTEVDFELMQRVETINKKHRKKND
jgi:UDPglucose 6-dehydrogenase